MEGKIGKIYLGQNKDEGKQEQFKKEDAPAPSLHNFNPLANDPIPLVIQMSNRKIQIEKFAFEKFRRFCWRRLCGCADAANDPIEEAPPFSQQKPDPLYGWLSISPMS